MAVYKSATIWESTPDPLDGYYVEITEPMGKFKTVLTNCDWFPTVEICMVWAQHQGAIVIYGK